MCMSLHVIVTKAIFHVCCVVCVQVYKLYLKYQVLVHDDSPDEVTK